jgi:hypothetical protein
LPVAHAEERFITAKRRLAAAERPFSLQRDGSQSQSDHLSPQSDREPPVLWQINRSKAKSEPFRRKSTDPRRRATPFVANQPIEGEERPFSWQIDQSKAKSDHFRRISTDRRRRATLFVANQPIEGEEPPVSSQTDQSKAKSDQFREQWTEVAE